MYINVNLNNKKKLNYSYFSIRLFINYKVRKIYKFPKASFMYFIVGIKDNVDNLKKKF